LPSFVISFLLFQLCRVQIRAANLYRLSSRHSRNWRRPRGRNLIVVVVHEDERVKAALSNELLRLSSAGS
jgi:hypothetical protein